MKEQLTFDQYKDKFIPNWRNIRYSGFCDPNEGWYYQWLESGHAESEVKERRERSSRFAEEDEQRKIQEEADYQEGLVEFTNQLYHLETLKQEYNGDLRKGILDWVKAKKSKDNVRNMMLKYAKELT